MIDQDERPTTDSDEIKPTTGGKRRRRPAPGKGARIAGAAGQVGPALGGLVGRVRAFARAHPVQATRRLAALVAVLAVLAGACWFGAHRHAETEQARADATKAAARSVVKLMSYYFGSVDRQVEQTQGLLTGPFKEDYANLVRTVIEPGAKDKQAVVSTAVLKSSVISSSPDEVTLLLFVTQQSQTLANPGGDQTESVVRVTLDKQGDTWLVSALKPE